MSGNVGVEETFASDELDGRTVYIINRAFQSTMLELQGGRNDPMTPVICDSGTGASSQQWQLSKVKGTEPFSIWHIKNAMGGTRLAISSLIPHNDIQINCVNADDSADNQKWILLKKKVDDREWYWIQNAYTGTCLDRERHSDGRVRAWRRNPNIEDEDQDQQWMIPIV